MKANQMHILIIHQAFAAMNEAGGTRHHEFARELAKAGHRVTIIASPISYLTGKSNQQTNQWVHRQQDGDLITILRCYTYSALHRSFVHRLFSFISFMFSSFIVGLGVEHVDVVWGTTPPIFQSFTAWLLARIKGAKFLLEVRDLWPAFAIAVGVLKNPVLIWLSEWLERFLYRHADVVMVNSPGFIQHVTDRGAGQVKLIPNGADPEMFIPGVGAGNFRTNHGIGNQFVIMYTGAHGISNDLTIVLESAEKLRNRQDILFVFVGDGKEKEHLQTRARLAELKNVMFLPACSKKEMADVLAAADACLAILQPLDMYKTTYPNKVFDYMAAGKPVLLAIDGVIRTVIEDSQGGVFARPGDAGALAESAGWMADHPQACRAMGAAGKVYLQSHYSRYAIAQDLLHLLQGLVEDER